MPGGWGLGVLSEPIPLFSWVRLRICPDDGWRLKRTPQLFGERLKPLQSLVWTHIAALRLEDSNHNRFWLLSLSAGRSDRLFRRWIATLASAHTSAGTPVKGLS